MDMVVVLDKPKGLTSQQAVSRAKRALKVKKAGHAGTLDPMATGVLLVLTGEATKISNLMMDLPKEYLATVKFGEATNTYDAEGEVVERVEGVKPSAPDVLEALGQFKGLIKQRPPAFSAIKQNGVPLYKLARAGKEVEAPEREVTVHDIEMESYEFPLLTISVACSKGTYIRSLAHDLGHALGTAAHLTGLVRTAVGDMRVERGVGLEELERGAGTEFISIDQALGHLPFITLTEPDHKRARHGNPFPASAYKPGPGICRLKDPHGRIFGIGRLAGEKVKVERIFNMDPDSSA